MLDTFRNLDQFRDYFDELQSIILKVIRFVTNANIGGKVWSKL